MNRTQDMRARKTTASDVLLIESRFSRERLTPCSQGQHSLTAHVSMGTKRVGLKPCLGKDCSHLWMLLLPLRRPHHYSSL